jgi:hypothetical protein
VYLVNKGFESGRVLSKVIIDASEIPQDIIKVFEAINLV